MRVFLGGATQPEIFEREDDELRALALMEISELLGTTGDPILVEVGRHPRAMPQYTLGHIDRVAAIRQQLAKHPGLILAGNAFDGVGIPDCIHGARAAADFALKALADSATPAAA